MQLGLSVRAGCASHALLSSDVLAVLIVYEYLITLDAEVNLIWKRKFTFVTVLWFFVGGESSYSCLSKVTDRLEDQNRYIMLFTQGPAVLCTSINWTIPSPRVHVGRLSGHYLLQFTSTHSPTR